MKIIENFISRLEVGDAQIFNRLTIKPVFAKTDFCLPFLTLEEALDKNILEITELAGGASVPELLVINHGTIDVIILEGEELRGAKQNRIVNATVIIPRNSEVVIPVSCVERGRWHFVSEKFSAGMNVASPNLRKLSHAAVSKNLREDDSYESDQTEIWAEIERKSARMNVESETEAFSEILYCRVTPEVERDLFEDLAYQENQIGFLAYIDGEFAGGDIFGSTELCAKQMEKMLRGYYLDALDEKEPAETNGETSIRAEEVFDQISTAHHQQFDAVGAGSEMRFENGVIQGAWKAVDETLAHLTIFPADGV